MKENSKNKKVMISMLAVALLILAVGMVAFALNNSPAKKLQDQLALGQKYLQELDYDNAIAAFEAAIEIDPMCAEAYLGLSEVYVAMENYDSALEILQKGYDLTGDERMQAEIDRIRELLEALMNAVEEDHVDIDEIEKIYVDDFLFEKTMYNFEIIGTTLSELTQEKMKEHAENQMSPLGEWNNEEEWYKGEGYIFWICTAYRPHPDAYRFIDNSACVSITNRDNQRYVTLQYGEAWNGIEDWFNGNVKLQNNAIINQQILGKTFKEYFDGIKDGLYEAIKFAAGNYESGKHVVFENGYAFNASGESLDERVTEQWVLIYEENGEQIQMEVISYSEEETIDTVTWIYE